MAELEDRMGAGEFLRWMRYEQQEPFLSQRVDLAGGMVASTMANIHRGKNVPAFEPLDFMPLAAAALAAARVESLRAEAYPAPVDEDDATLQRMVAAFGGRPNG